MFNEELKEARNKWETKILDFLNNLYKGQWIPSHDIFHHQRVLDNAIKLLPAFSDEITQERNEVFEQVLLACYFHDTGLLVDPGFEHGVESAKICARFLEQHKEIGNFNTDQLFLAIEKHDQKEYSSARRGEFQLLHKVLTLADDIDAFGAVGAHRYAEIYLCRGLALTAIPEKILSNSAERYHNLMHFVPNANPDIENAYRTLIKIYSSGTFSDSPESLLELINKELILPKQQPLECFKGLVRGGSVEGSRRHYFLCHFLQEWESKINE